MAQTIKSAQARWDTDSDATNPGWVVEIERADGERDTIAAAPGVYHEPEDADTDRITKETLKWEGLELSE